MTTLDQHHIAQLDPAVAVPAYDRTAVTVAVIAAVVLMFSVVSRPPPLLPKEKKQVRNRAFLIGGVFVVESLSVIIQVISFRRFGRRVFRMAPIHHHFEMLNWSETKIIVRFWIVAALFAASGFAPSSLHSRRLDLLLDQLLAGIGLDRSKVFITNVVRHRPPENRDPLPEEVAACHVWFERHLAALKPKVVVTLGRHAMYKFFPGESISRVHGRARKKDGITIFPVFHPAAALHQPSLRSDLEQDFQALAAFLESPPRPNVPAPEPAKPAEKPAEQMTLLG